ncbi:MAG: nuclear transport factor 2 family protein [Planctomycetes bacterium]|nr:nuclear transport factor 2 family protein [Planctomycetota bacterium]
MSQPLPLFVEAFNASDLDAMAALLSTNATAQVLGAPFPEEQGADVIRHTSFPHICELEGAASLGSVREVRRRAEGPPLQRSRRLVPVPVPVPDLRPLGQVVRGR